MKQIVVGMRCRMVKEGVPDIDLLVHCDLYGRPSPCVVIEDESTSLIGGHIETVEQIFQYQIAKHQGYVVEGLQKFIAA